MSCLLARYSVGMLKQVGYVNSSQRTGTVRLSKGSTDESTNNNSKNDNVKREECQTNEEPAFDEEGRFINPLTGERGGPRGLEPTRYGDWERKGRLIWMSDLSITLDTRSLVSHHISEFEDVRDYLLVRRGQPFTLHVETSDPSLLLDQFFPKDVYLVYPQEGSNTTLLVAPKTCRMTNKKATSLSITVTLDPRNTPIVSPAKLSVIIEQTKGPVRRRQSSTGDESASKLAAVESQQRTLSVLSDLEIVVLFNPWCKEDPVYMEGDSRLKEYLLSERGRIWWGGKASRAWFFGQFEPQSLQAIIKIMRAVPFEDKMSPVSIVRALTYHVNDKVLEGNWSGDYSGGSVPTAWTGSVKILSKFLESGQIVKYGQCWVFSGVLTTLCRTAGIPSRSVTNYVSAHDARKMTRKDLEITGGYNRIVDIFLDEKGGMMDNLTDDSIWNFHVWNEVWMQRHDLVEAAFGGWQAIDSTPQELSDGKYQCGPCPVFAIKSGKNVKYDSVFIFGEVNADYVLRQKQADSSFKEVSRDAKHVGKFISTKAVASNSRDDVTLEYKHSEGTIEERIAFSSIGGSVTVQPDVLVEFDLKDIQVGEDGQGVLKVISKSSEDRTISVSIQGYLLRYNGVRIKKMFTSEAEGILISSGESTEFDIRVQAEYYEGHVFDKVMVQCYTYTKVIETGETSVSIDIANFITAPPMVTLPVSVKAGEIFDIKVNYINTLKNTTLKNLTFELAAIRGATKGFEKVIGDSLAPGQSIDDIISTSIVKAGIYELDFDLSCNQLGTNPVSFEITVQ